MEKTEDGSITKALEKEDWARLRELSIKGFEGHRDTVWPFLLHVVASGPHKVSEEEVDSSRESLKHADEHQVSLDVDRSFIFYPQENYPNQKQRLQKELNELIITTLRHRPSLRYFQGYHDIVSVLLLTLPEELRLVCVDRMSLHRLRDAMGKTLEPHIGQLRILRNLIRLTDPTFAKVLESNTPLPYFSLSQLLTLFSHDVPSLGQIQRVFDYLLCRDPLSSVYLAAQLLLDRKVVICRMIEEEDDGMLHTLLSSWPIQEDAHHSNFPADNDLNLLETNSLGDESPKTSPSFSPEDLESSPPVGVIKGLYGDGIKDEMMAARIDQELTQLLHRADELRSLFPPQHAELGVKSILGPHSVHFTWSQNVTTLPLDELAETWTEDTDMVVYPYTPTPPPSDDESPRRKAISRRPMRPARLSIDTHIMAAGFVIIASIIAIYYGDKASGGRSRLWWNSVGGQVFQRRWSRKLFPSFW